MTGRQHHELLTTVEEEWISRQDERAGLPMDGGGEGGVYFDFGSGLQKFELHPLCLRCFPQLSQLTLVGRNVRVNKHGDQRHLRSHFPQQLKPLGIQIGNQKADAREVATGPG